MPSIGGSGTPPRSAQRGMGGAVSPGGVKKADPGLALGTQRFGDVVRDKMSRFYGGGQADNALPASQMGENADMTNPQSQAQAARALASQKLQEKRERRGQAMEQSGRAMETAGKATKYAGRAVDKAGQGMIKAGQGLSSTGVGAIVGVPLMALGGGARVAGKGAEGAGKVTEETGKKVKAQGKKIKENARAKQQGLADKTTGRLNKLSKLYIKIAFNGLVGVFTFLPAFIYLNLNFVCHYILHLGKKLFVKFNMWQLMGFFITWFVVGVVILIGFIIDMVESEPWRAKWEAIKMLTGIN